MDNWMVQIIVAVLTGGTVTKIVEWIIVAIKNKKRKKFTRLLPVIHNIYQHLNTLKRETNCHRVLILKSHNGGGVPKLGSQLRSTVIYEAFDAPLRSLKMAWQNQILDESYVELLYEMNLKGQIAIETKTMPSGILKTLYRSQKLTASRVFKIAEQKKSLIYLVMNYTEDAPLDMEDPRQADIIRVIISDLRTIFEKSPHE